MALDILRIYKSQIFIQYKLGVECEMIFFAFSMEGYSFKYMECHAKL